MNRGVASSRRRRSIGIVAATLSSVLLLGACSSDGPASPTTLVVSPLAIDQIGPAVTAVEEQLGGPQQYLEINATSHLVNLFVANVDATMVTPFVYIDGALSSVASVSATGASFTYADVDYDPALVGSRVTADLPGSVQDVFAIANEGGAIQLSIQVTGAGGEGLLAVVAGDGTVLAVTDP